MSEDAFRAELAELDKKIAERIAAGDDAWAQALGAQRTSIQMHYILGDYNDPPHPWWKRLMRRD